MKINSVNVAAAMILQSLAAQAADIPSRRLDASPSCTAGIPLSYRLDHQGRNRLGAAAANKTCIGKSLSTDDSHISPETEIAEARGPERGPALSDDQLDAVAAGLAARAAGDAQAEGAEVGSNVGTLAIIGQPGSQNALSMGQATAVASGPTAAGPATASSSLTLTVAVP
jgi:hypothetical protein